MEQINSFLKNPQQVSKANSERAELVGYFTDKVNSYRINTKYKPVGYKTMAIRLSHFSLQDLYNIKSYAKQAKNWEKYFWYITKTKKKLSTYPPYI